MNHLILYKIIDYSCLTVLIINILYTTFCNLTGNLSIKNETIRCSVTMITTPTANKQVPPTPM